MENKKYAKEPLLYIEQNVGPAPQAPMQHNYITPKIKVSTSEDSQPQPQAQPDKNRKQRVLRRDFISNEKAEVQTETGLVEDSGREERSNKEKKFNEMTILEKVAYLIERPEHAPQIRSEIRTKDDVFRGVVTGSDEKNVLIRVGRRVSSSEIALSDIQSISILGF